MKSWPAHPLADLFPPLPAADYEALKADIAEQGVLTPVVLWNGQLVDGRHRMRAAVELGKDFDTVTLACAESDLPKKVASYNLHRRHLTVSQRAMIAHEMEQMAHGGDRKSSDLKDHLKPKALVSREQAAEVMRVSYPTITRAARVVRESPPEVVAAVKAGEMTVTEAHDRIAPRAKKDSPTPPELRRLPVKPKGEQFERTLAAIETHIETLTEIWDKVTPTNDWLERLRGVRRSLATITHDLEKAAA